jgi:hypothetical protein
LGSAPPVGFDCGDADLNEFLLEDALPHQTDLLTVTYADIFPRCFSRNT